jgi:membrane-associated phospholipid phosphatase
LEKSGDILRIAIPAYAYAYTFYKDDEAGRNEFYKSFLTNGLATYSLKYTVDETRPNGEKRSFPSGHTSTSFQGAVFMHKRYGFTNALPLYAAAIFVGHSRLESNAHHPIDIFAGAALGFASSWFLTTEYKDILIHSSVDTSSVSINFTKRF